MGGNGHEKDTLALAIIDKLVRDVKQDQKINPDLVQSIIRPTRLAKEELRMILMKIHHFRATIKEFRVCTVGFGKKMTDFCGGCLQEQIRWFSFLSLIHI